MKKRSSPLVSLLIVLVVVGAGYLSAYLALVQREPVYYGNRLKQLALPIVGAGSTSQIAAAAVVDPPDAYRVKYRLKHEWIGVVFAPAHWLDRTIRPGYWPEVDLRRVC